MIFASKIDRWFMMVAIAATLLPILALFASPPVNRTKIIGILLAALLLALLLWYPILNTRYTLSADKLHIRSGLFQWDIRVDTISRLEKTSDAASSPALSLDRIRIHYHEDGQQKSILISPADQTLFWQQLSAMLKTP